MRVVDKTRGRICAVGWQGVARPTTYYVQDTKVA